MSLANKMAKMGTTMPLPNGGMDPRLAAGGRFLGPPIFMGNGNYMGDPGIFGFLGRAVRGITGVVGGLGIPGISGVSRGISGLFGGRTAIPGASTIPGPVLMPRAMPRFPVAMPGGLSPARALISQQSIPFRTPGIAGAAQRLIPGGATGFQAPPPTATMGGYHLNKSSYFLMDGTFIAAGTKWVKNRRRNPGNMRALSRSLGRIKSAKKMATVLGRVTIRKKC